MTYLTQAVSEVCCRDRSKFLGLVPRILLISISSSSFIFDRVLQELFSHSLYVLHFLRPSVLRSISIHLIFPRGLLLLKSFSELFRSGFVFSFRLWGVLDVSVEDEWFLGLVGRFVFLDEKLLVVFCAVIFLTSVRIGSSSPADALDVWLQKCGTSAKEEKQNVNLIRKIT